MPTSYLLVMHGSRDPRPQAALEKLAQGVRRHLAARANFTDSSVPLVRTASLELGPTSLDEQITQYGRQVLAFGIDQIQLLPLFLLSGVHVQEDIPAAVAQAQQAIGKEVSLNLRPHLGTHLGLTKLVADEMARLPVDAWILLAHGSRRSGSNARIERISSTIQAVPAYWSLPPKLEKRVRELAAAGCQRIGIMPYFLFSGSTTDAIAGEVARLEAEFPQQLQLATPIEPSGDLVNLILDLIGLPANLGSTCGLE